MIALYYKNFIYGDNFNYDNTTSEQMTVSLHQLIRNNIRSYGILKGKVLYIHIRQHDGILYADLNLINNSKYMTRNTMLASRSEKELFDMLEGALKSYTNTIIFFITTDKRYDYDIRDISNRLKIKRKKSLTFEEIVK